MANAVQAFINTFNASLGGAESANLTFSFAITQEFEAFIPIQITVSANLSFAPEVWYYQSGDGGEDGGGTWETVGSVARVFDIDGGGANQGYRYRVGSHSY